MRCSDDNTVATELQLINNIFQSLLPFLVNGKDRRQRCGDGAKKIVDDKFYAPYFR